MLARPRSWNSSVWLVATLAALCPFTSTQAAEVRIVASPSISAMMKALGRRFESETGHKLVFFYGLVPAQEQKIEAGEFDLAIVPEGVIDHAIAQDKIDPQTRIQIARTGLGIGKREGADTPRLDTTESFKQALLGAKTISYVTKEPSGKQVSQDFERLGIADAMKSKIVSKESIAQVWQAVASGEAELGVGFIPNAKAAQGVEFVGPFPPDLQFYTTIAAGVGVAARQPDAAKAFVKYLTGPDTGAVIRANGFEPAMR